MVLSIVATGDQPIGDALAQVSREHTMTQRAQGQAVGIRCQILLKGSAFGYVLRCAANVDLSIVAGRSDVKPCGSTRASRYPSGDS